MYEEIQAARKMGRHITCSNSMRSRRTAIILPYHYGVSFLSAAGGAKRRTQCVNKQCDDALVGPNNSWRE